MTEDDERVDSTRKSTSPYLLLAYPALKKRSRKLQKQKAAIDHILKKIENMLTALPAPTLEEYKKMITGQIPVTPEALLLGALNAVAFQLEEASYDLEGYFKHSAADLRKGYVDPRLLAHLGVLVVERERKNPPSSAD